MTETHPLTTTTFELPGYRVTKSFGVVRGIIVRSRSIIGNIGAGLQSLFGGNISLYTSMCERARSDAFNDMLAAAGQLGANAVIGVRYDATEISAGITEVLCYGTAVHVEAISYAVFCLKKKKRTESLRLARHFRPLGPAPCPPRRCHAQ